MSPRRTEALHEIGDGEHLGAVVDVALQRGDFRGERLPLTEPRCSLDKGSPDCL
jgi:hypothetical protein